MEKILSHPESGVEPLRVTHRKARRLSSRSVRRPSIRIRCGCCQETLIIDYDEILTNRPSLATLEIGGVMGTIGQWRTALLPLLQIPFDEKIGDYQKWCHFHAVLWGIALLEDAEIAEFCRFLYNLLEQPEKRFFFNALRRDSAFVHGQPSSRLNLLEKVEGRLHYLKFFDQPTRTRILALFTMEEEQTYFVLSSEDFERLRNHPPNEELKELLASKPPWD